MDANTKLKTVYKVKWKNLGVLLLLIVLAGGLIFGTVKIVKYIIDYKSTSQVINEFKQNVNIDNLVDDEFTKTIKPDSSLSKFDIYWDYIKLGLIDVNMASLKKINSDSVGYVEIKGIDFSYPVVKSEEDIYKKTSFDKKENQLGWIYLDKRSSLETLGTNTVIMGNKVIGDNLMGVLNGIFKKEWTDDKNNYVIKYSTNYYSTLWQIISVYHTKDKNYLKYDFENEDEVKKYFEESIGKSEIKFKAGILPSDKFLTIATNSNGTNIVIQAKLIKIREEQ